MIGQEVVKIMRGKRGSANPCVHAWAILTAIGCLSCTGVIDAGDEEGDDVDGDRDQVERPTASEWSPAPEPLALTDVQIAMVSARAQQVLDALPYSHTVRARNLTTGQDLFASNADALLKPASNMKLFTSAAALEILGEDHPMAMRAYATGTVDGTGVVSGDLVIVSRHDFSPSTFFYPGPAVPLERFAAQLARAGITRVEGDVILSGEVLYDGYQFGYLDVGAERASTVGPLQAALAASGIAITGGVSSAGALDPPEGATLISEHDPLPLRVGLSPLNVVSNNEFADQLSRHLGWQMLGDSSYAGGERAMIDWLDSFGAPTSGVQFQDGSGLSHDNRVSANLVISLLEFMNGSPLGPAWRRTLAIGGVRGTIAGRLGGGDTLGRVYAKTGTLSDTISLSGYIDNRHDGQRYAFSVLFNAVTDQGRARGAADEIAAAVAGNLRASGARPSAPRLDVVRGLGHEGMLELAWSSVPEAEAYLIWLSDDGSTWPRERARMSEETHFIADELSASSPTYVKVTALGAGGLESDASAVLAAVASDSESAVLVVDANERWLAEPAAENTLAENHDHLAGLVASLGASVDSASAAAVTRGDVALGGYAMVLWAAGEESTADDALSSDEKAVLADYFASGGALILSGSELFWTLDQRADADDRAFESDVLHASLAEDDAGTYEVRGAPETPFSDIDLASFLSPDTLHIAYPDVIDAGMGATPLLLYEGGVGGAAAVGYTEGSGRVIATGFPIEAMPRPSDRGAVLAAALAYLGL